MHSCNRQSNSSPLRNSREPVNKKGPFINTYIRLDCMDVGMSLVIVRGKKMMMYVSAFIFGTFY